MKNRPRILPVEIADEIGTLQALIYHADQAGEFARFLGGNGITSRERSHSTGIDNVAGQLIQQVRRRAVSAQICLASPLRSSPADPLDVLRNTLLEGEGRTQLLISRSLHAEGPDQRWLSTVAWKDTTVRIASPDLSDMILIDDTIGILGDSSTRHSAMRDKAMIKCFKYLFNATWEYSVDLTRFADIDHELLLTGDITRESSSLAKVLPLLADGWTDAAAAQRLGWSVRTYRRHVADLMRRLRARSRFHAGMLAAQLQLGSSAAE